MFRIVKFKLAVIALITVLLSLTIFTGIASAGTKAAGNRAPIITQGKSISIVTNEDIPKTLTLNATDADKNELLWSVSAIASKGTITVDSMSASAGISQITYLYTPGANLNGTDSFTAKVSDGKGGTASILVKVTINPINDSPSNTAVPSISGTAVVGSTLSANPGSWTDVDGNSLTYAYQWQQADTSDASVGTDLQSGNTYSLIAANAGRYIRVKVTASDGMGGNTVAYSPWLLVNAATQTINYVALGDSIATGTCYPGKIITSYVTYFYQYIQSKNPGVNVNFTNLAVDGYKSNDWYAMLGADGSVGDTNTIQAVQKANIITLSIGGNNLMQAAKDDTALGGYNFNKIDTTVAEQGRADFEAQWVKIINRLKVLNPSAKIIAITIYNPYNESDTNLHSTVDSYLFNTKMTGINDMIRNNSSLGYYVADVYGSFNTTYSNKMGAVTYFYPGPLDVLGMLTRNPHPNPTGQAIITSLHNTIYDTIKAQP